MTRPAVAADAAFLAEVLVMAAHWRPGAVLPAVEEVLAVPELAHYVEGWPRPGDAGVVAEQEGRPVGAAWWRRFDPSDPGYGFVDEHVPEVSVGVVPEARGCGVGTMLLESLLATARDAGLSALSLSVEVDNPAVRLYRRLGFEEVAASPGALTMVVRPTP